MFVCLFVSVGVMQTKLFSVLHRYWSHLEETSEDYGGSYNAWTSIQYWILAFYTIMCYQMFSVLISVSTGGLCHLVSRLTSGCHSVTPRLSQCDTTSCITWHCLSSSQVLWYVTPVVTGLLRNVNTHRSWARRYWRRCCHGNQNMADAVGWWLSVGCYEWVVGLCLRGRMHVLSRTIDRRQETNTDTSTRFVIKTN